ncbi:MAG: GDP-L-fucose synthase [Candidatus Poribacteria bacterium]|nr:GDP-L-fucose synthase [Candidatus Poribacteria bacterium]
MLDDAILGRLKDDRVLLTGGAGFLGSHLKARLEPHVAALFVPRTATHDLRQESAVKQVFAEFKPTLVIHAAATVGGIGLNREQPATMFDDNMRMSFFLTEQSYLAGVRKFVGLGTICAYPKFTPVPFKEEDLWNGYPEETNAPYGFAKKLLIVQGQAYAQQYGFNAVHLLVVNLYGPGDNFSEKSSHVIPALIRRFSESKKARAKTVVCWGDGTPTREFLYVEDGAEGIIRATELYDSIDPINIGSGFEITMRELAELIAEIVGFDGEIEWDTSKPNGQPRRKLDTSKAETAFGFHAQTDFRTGLKRTIEWYRENESEILKT